MEMSLAICFKCGERKNQPFDACAECGSVPTSASERTVSLAMSTYITPDSQLARYGAEIAGGEKPSIPLSVLSKAIVGVKSGLGVGSDGAFSSDNEPHQSASTASYAKPLDDKPVRTPVSGPTSRRLGTSLDDVPFAVLGVTLRDTRQRIIELAEERSLEIDPAVCEKARGDLTNLRTRLAVELAWFPGLSPGRISKCVDALYHDPLSVRDEVSLPPLAHLNLMTYALEAAKDLNSEDGVAAFLCKIAELSDDVDADVVLRDINEDRNVAGFQPLRSTEQVEIALADRKRRYRDVMKGALNKMSSATLVHVLTKAVDTATASGETPAPALLDDLVDSYAVEVQSTLDAGAERIGKLVESIKTSVSSDPIGVDARIAQLEAATRRWDAIAQPIQLSAKARGIDDDLSSSIAYKIRGLALDLFNNHDLLAQSQRVTKMLQEVFAELPEVAERIDKDVNDLEEIAGSRAEADAFEPVRLRCQQATKDADANPSAAHLEGNRLLHDGVTLLKSAPVDAGSPAYRDAKDLIAATLMHCAIAYGNETSTWEPCVALLARALELATDTALRQRISENLATTKSNHANLSDCDPISKAPSLHTVNSIGFTLYGRTDPRPGGSYMATYYFVVLAIPIFPIARYRVIPIANGYRFLGKGQLRTIDKWHLGISLALIGWVVLAAVG